MFLARGVAVSLADFVLLYTLLCLLVLGSWRMLRRLAPGALARCSANLLFGLRILPLAGAALLTLVFVIPSFLLLEPRSADEAIGIAPTALGFCCLGLFVLGVFRAVSAQAKVSRAMSEWLSGAKEMQGPVAVPVFQTRKGAPPLTVAGVRFPRVLVSEAAVAVLETREFSTALEHELAHVRNHDNLKKLLLQFSPFPGMGDLQQAWLQAAEMEADDAAVSSLPEALDLAAALIKLSKLAPRSISPELAATFAESAGKLVQARVERLFAWEEFHTTVRLKLAWWQTAPAALAGMLVAAMAYSSVIERMHEMTEWLVR